MKRDPHEKILLLIAVVVTYVAVISIVAAVTR